jgi:hypothetical protein
VKSGAVSPIVKLIVNLRSIEVGPMPDGVRSHSSSETLRIQRSLDVPLEG